MVQAAGDTDSGDMGRMKEVQDSGRQGGGGVVGVGLGVVVGGKVVKIVD